MSTKRCKDGERDLEGWQRDKQTGGGEGGQ